MRKLRTTFFNFALIAISILFAFGLLETIVFRYILVAADLPYLEENTAGVLKYVPGQKGIYRLHDEISATFNINSNGWNSGYANYTEEKKSSTKRICIVGDSYIEALQVDYQSSMAERLEHKLRKRGNNVEVYRFGISGAPLSHYVYMIENEVVKYDPDIVVINLVHNDFAESITPAIGTYSDSFSRIVDDLRGGVTLSTPAFYKRKPSWWLKTSYTFRYLWVRKQIRPSVLKQLWIKMFERNSKEESRQYSANVEVASTNDERVLGSIDAMFNRLNAIEEQLGIKMLLVMDGDRASIINAIDLGEPVTSLVSHLNDQVGAIARDYGISLLDLTNVFAEDYRKNKNPFRFRTDGHWNQHAHDVVAASVADRLINQQFLK